MYLQITDDELTDIVYVITLKDVLQRRINNVTRTVDKDYTVKIVKISHYRLNNIV